MNDKLRQEINRELDEAKGRAEEKWVRRPKVDLVMISISYVIADADGNEFPMSTWATGTDEATALAKWRKRRMGSLPRGQLKVAVVTKTKRAQYIYQEPLGARVGGEDKLLEAANDAQDWNWKELMK